MKTVESQANIFLPDIKKLEQFYDGYFWKRKYMFIGYVLLRQITVQTIVSRSRSAAAQTLILILILFIVSCETLLHEIQEMLKRKILWKC